jgi:hypothetical protein
VNRRTQRHTAGWLGRRAVHGPTADGAHQLILRGYLLVISGDTPVGVWGGHLEFLPK